MVGLQEQKEKVAAINVNDNQRVSLDNRQYPAGGNREEERTAQARFC